MYRHRRRCLLAPSLKNERRSAAGCQRHDGHVPVCGEKAAKLQATELLPEPLLPAKSIEEPNYSLKQINMLRLAKAAHFDSIRAKIHPMQLNPMDLTEIKPTPLAVDGVLPALDPFAAPCCGLWSLQP